ncbi:hypothetical protein CHX27_02915 [Flavobacterium aurantiibacter]|uniref:Uncharacterized protein n=1 Tax=Flavobacterium aurantiibacter TaxID=2023067 RepID=A0A256A1T4_9FLAO|nr:hypothetical protein CHX27_02915 [Flavobacterium aurantiibacter]
MRKSKFLNGIVQRRFCSCNDFLPTICCDCFGYWLRAHLGLIAFRNHSKNNSLALSMLYG